MSFCVFDVETTFSKDYGRAGNPFIDTNEVVLCGVTTNNSPDAPCPRDLNKIIKKVDITTDIPLSMFRYRTLVAHNSKFDFLWCLRYHYKDTLEWCKKGGVLWCTQFTEYLLSGKTNKMAKLTELAPKYGGIPKPDKVKELWDAGFQTKDIPRYELDYYLTYDVDNTRLIYEQQLKKVMDKGLLPSLEAKFGYMVLTALCEHFGMYVVREELEGMRLHYLGLRDKLDLEIRQLVLEQVTDKYIHLIDLAKNYHVSALIYGGTIEYDTPEVAHRKDGKQYFKHHWQTIDVPGCGLEINEEAETKAKGIGKTDSDTLGWFRHIPFVDKLITYREVAQVLKTYLDPDGNGVLGLIHPDSCIHGYLGHAFTSTERLNSSVPNMQNIDKASPIKTAFKSRFPDGFIVEADAVGLENCTMGQISKDENLICDLWDGVDLHSKRAAFLNGYNYDEFIKRINDKDPSFIKMRSNAKAPSFAYAYGAGEKKLVEDTHLSVTIIRKFINGNKRMYPVAVSFYDDLYRALLPAAVETKLLTPEGNNKMATYWNNPFGWPLVFTSKDSPVWIMQREAVKRLGWEHPFTEFIKNKKEKDRKKIIEWFEEHGKPSIPLTSFTPTVFKNYPNQNLAAEIIQLFGSLLLTKLWDYIILNSILPINTIHDSYIFDVRDQVHADILIQVIKDCQDQFPRLMGDKFGVKLVVPIKFDVKYSKTWKPVVEEV